MSWRLKVGNSHTRVVGDNNYSCMQKTWIFTAFEIDVLKTANWSATSCNLLPSAKQLGCIKKTIKLQSVGVSLLSACSSRAITSFS